MNTSTTARRRPGERLAPFALESLVHGSVQVPGAGFTHLQFRRFTGCPVCNLHLRSFAREHQRIASAGVQTIAFFHSPREAMLPYQGSLPFPTVPDPQRRWYREFGAERSLLAVLHPRVMCAALRGLVGARSNPFAGGSEQAGLPADILLDSAGVIVATHYGKHADDQWSIEELLVMVAVASKRESLAAAAGASTGSSQ
jgi:hypothetical protein